MFIFLLNLLFGKEYFMNHDEAIAILGTGQTLSIAHVLKCLDVSYWAMRENKDFSKLDELVEAKNTLLRECVEEEKRVRRFFKIPDHAPFKNLCPACKGAGEIYKFLRTIKQIKCKVCLGKKEVWVACPDCLGTTVFKKKPDSKGITCRNCLKYYENEPDEKKAAERKGKVPFKCSACRGTGSKPILIVSHKIESTTPCKKCDQLGFLPPKMKKTELNRIVRHSQQPMSNPVLTKDIAEKLAQPMPEKPEEEMIEPNIPDEQNDNDETSPPAE